MCSRFELLTTVESIVAGAALRVAPRGLDAGRLARAEVRPTDPSPIIGADGALVLLPWGLRVDWQPQPVINARAETLADKPTFRPLLDHRCLVPATAYFEWRKAGRTKIKTRISAADRPVMMFAGLIGGGRFVIVTCAPAPTIAHIHDRMPVILPPAAQPAWLSARPFADIRGVLAPYNGTLRAEEISPARQGELAL
jgi:putative SOS response-associated peptidase YedK